MLPFTCPRRSPRACRGRSLPPADRLALRDSPHTLELNAEGIEPEGDKELAGRGPGDYERRQEDGRADDVDLLRAREDVHGWALAAAASGLLRDVEMASDRVGDREERPVVYDDLEPLFGGR